MSTRRPVTFFPPDPAEAPNGIVVLGIEPVITNTGRSVANDIRVAMRLRFIGPKSDLIPADADKVAIETCDIQPAPVVAGKVLFPSDKTSEYRELVEAIPDDAIYPPPPQWSGSLRMDKSVQLLLVGCIAYRFMNSPPVHRTWFTYKIGKRVPRKEEAWQTWSFELGRRVPGNNVFFEKLPLGGNGAD